MIDRNPRASYLPGASVVLNETPQCPVMTVLRAGIWGNQAWYIVAWLDSANHRHEAFLAEAELRPATATLPS